MGGFRGALYLAVAAGDGCQFFAEHCWLQSSFPHALSPSQPSQPLAAGRAVDAEGGAAGTAAAGIDVDTASGADIGVEFVCESLRGGGRAPSGPTAGLVTAVTAAAGSDTLLAADPAVGLLRSTTACSACHSGRHLSLMGPRVARRRGPGKGRGRRRRLARFPAAATFKFTDPAVATFTDPAVGEHSIPTDPAVTDPAVGTPGISPASPAPAVGGAGGR